MQKLFLHLTFIILIFNITYSSGQNINSFSKNEKINLFTDRTSYISGEDIFFVAYLSLCIHETEWISDTPSQNLSSIIYIELIKPNGDRIIGEKILCKNSSGKGIISIPKEVMSGMYYIKAYTKFMRNNNPATYSYTLIKIINPFNPEVLNYHSANENIDTIQLNNLTLGNNPFSVITNKEVYSTRDSAKIKINYSRIAIKSVTGVNISIVPEYSFNDCIINPLPSDENLIDQFYYPETFGLSLTGIVKESKSDNPIANIPVNLSILGDFKDFMAVRTNSQGRFFFKIPDFRGAKDIFICTEMIDDSKSIILIDNDFCQRKINMPTPVFKLNEAEKRIVLKLAQNFQITSSFHKKIKEDSTKYANKAFYGEPQEKLIFDKYIQLPTIEDYINEIIPTLKIRKHKGRKYFRLYRTQSELEIYKPLVLLDLVAIDNPEKILSLSPQNISYVETVNSPYVKGDILYGGIISFFSKKGDFAGIDLPSSGIFLNFNFLGNSYNSSKEVKLNDNQPDSRNTLLWEPNMILDSKGIYEQSFITSDTPGKYIILLRGITKDGKAFLIKKSILIKE